MGFEPTSLKPTDWKYCVQYPSGEPPYPLVRNRRVTHLFEHHLEFISHSRIANEPLVRDRLDGCLNGSNLRSVRGTFPFKGSAESRAVGQPYIVRRACQMGPRLKGGLIPYANQQRSKVSEPESTQCPFLLAAPYRTEQQGCLMDQVCRLLGYLPNAHRDLASIKN
jgi:hypothetical protein